MTIDDYVAKILKPAIERGKLKFPAWYVSDAGLDNFYGINSRVGVADFQRLRSYVDPKATTAVATTASGYVPNTYTSAIRRQVRWSQSEMVTDKFLTDEALEILGYPKKAAITKHPLTQEELDELSWANKAPLEESSGARLSIADDPKQWTTLWRDPISG